MRSDCIDLTNKTFGHLTVLEPSIVKNRRRRWLCRCVCGTEKDFGGEELRRGTAKSCGCKGAYVNFQNLIQLRKVGRKFLVFCWCCGRTSVIKRHKFAANHCGCRNKPSGHRGNYRLGAEVRRLRRTKVALAPYAHNEQYNDVLLLWKKGLSYEEISNTTIFSADRCEQIVAKARCAAG